MALTSAPAGPSTQATGSTSPCTAGSVHGLSGAVSVQRPSRFSPCSAEISRRSKAKPRSASEARPATLGGGGKSSAQVPGRGAASGGAGASGMAAASAASCSGSNPNTTAHEAEPQEKRADRERHERERDAPGVSRVEYRRGAARRQARRNRAAVGGAESIAMYVFPRVFAIAQGAAPDRRSGSASIRQRVSCSAWSTATSTAVSVNPPTRAKVHTERMFEDWYGLFATPKVVGKTRRALAVSTRGVYVPEAKDVDGVHVSTPLSNAGIDTGSWIVAEAASRSWAPSEYAPRPRRRVARRRGSAPGRAWLLARVAP